MLIDTHAHLYLCKEKESEIILNAKKNNVVYIINIGIDLSTSLEAYKSSQDNKRIIPTIGIHPSSYEDLSRIEEMEKMLKQYQFKAIGEAGLDYYRDYTSKENQILLFKHQVDLARKYNLPLIIHNRKADADILKILQNCQDLKIVFHCYSTDVAFAKAVLRKNVYFSFAGNITYSKKGKIVETIKYLPLEHIMLETDSPYLTPQKYQGQENQPANIVEIAKKISDLKNCSLSAVADKTSENAMRFFDLT